MKTKLIYFLVVVVGLSAYLFLRPKKASLPPGPEVLWGCTTSDYYDSLLMRPVIRIQRATKFNREEMLEAAEYIRRFKTNPHLTILFREDDKRADYARIEMPGLIMTELY